MVVSTDRVDASSLLTARVVLTLVDVTITQSALATWRTGAGERSRELQTGGVVETGGRVTLSYVVLAEISLEPGQAGTVEVGVVLRAAATVLTGLGGAEALPDTASRGGGVSGVSRATETGGRACHHPTHRVVRTFHPGTAVLLTPRPGVSRRTGAGGGPFTDLAGPAVTAETLSVTAEVQCGLTGPAGEPTPAVAQKAARLV